MLTPRLLYVNAYDSFASNIVALLEETLHAAVTVVTIDDPNINALSAQQFGDHLRNRFDAVVVGPGPGDPNNPEDVGFIPRVWALKEDDLVPVLGICLGFQSMCLAFGAHVTRLKEPKHGLVTDIRVRPKTILNSHQTLAASIRVTHYHSLRVQLPDFDICTLWTDTEQLRPLAWDLNDNDNGPVLEAVQHRHRPYWGVQFHPESICTTQGEQIVTNWWSVATQWLRCHCPQRLASGAIAAELAPSPELFGTPDPAFGSRAVARLDYASLGPLLGERVRSTTIPTGHTRVNQLCDFLRVAEREVVLLESGLGMDGAILYPRTGRHSILGVISEKTIKISYDISTETLSIVSGTQLLVSRTVMDVWAYLEEWIDRMRVTGGNNDCPFWGGLIGYISYETGLKTRLRINTATMTDKQPNCYTPPCRPDLTFAVVTRSVVVDHTRKVMYIQSILENDGSWVCETAMALVKWVHNRLAQEDTYSWWPPHPNNPTKPTSYSDWSAWLDIPNASTAEVMDKAGDYILEHTHGQNASKTVFQKRPNKEEYCRKVSQCDEEIRAGNSYELCLTDSSEVCVPSVDSRIAYPWLLYRRLMRQNSAPFATYLRLSTGTNMITIIGSSPERFLSWDRDGLCEFRPIKGTVKKSPSISLQEATEILLSSKEVAENLMIVDLIRHDLNSVKGASSVRVPQLFGIEEYMTVYQLVSVIQGQLPIPRSPAEQRPKSLPVTSSQHSSLRESKALPQQLKASAVSNVPIRAAPRRRAASNTASSADNTPRATGLAVLRSSLPPGSMTGAPKLRSCQILRELEQRPRGVYSGVVGYIDVGGAGDFSVVIRTAYRWADDRTPDGRDVWTVGAGGAVTVKSTPQAEYEEMVVKANTVLRAFGVEME